MDMLIHVSVMDLQRNIQRYYVNPPSPLDRFAPGWRESVDISKPHLPRQLLNYWLEQIRGLGKAPAEGIERVSGPRNQNLYWLVFVTQHEIAEKFWNAIRDVGMQRKLL